MKKIIIALLVLSLMCTISGCGQNNAPDNTRDTEKDVLTATDSESVEKTTVDKEFLDDLKEALESRWKLADDDSVSTSKLLKVEYDVFNAKNYRDMEFEDEQLKEQAMKYLDGLDEQKEATKYENSDYDLFDEKWNEGACSRYNVIIFLYDNYSLEISDDEIEEVKSELESMEDEKQKKVIAESLVDNISFELEEDDGFGGRTYSAIVENTTDYEIVDLSVDVSLIDKDGVYIETEYSYMENIPAGEKGKMEFWTTKEFDSMKVKLGYYEFK